MKKADLLVKNGTIITMDKKRRILKGSVAIYRGEIVSIGKPISAKKTIDAKGGLIIPGLINAHCHTPMTIFRGYVDDIPLKIWLEDYIWPLEDKYISPKTVRIGTSLAMIEMIRSGTTTFGDMYFFGNEIAQLAKKFGMRAVVGEGLIDSPTPNYKDPIEGLKYSEDLAKRWKDDPLISASINPHSPHTCPKQVLRAAKKVADKYSIQYKILVSESDIEVKESKKEHKKTPIEYLDKMGILDENTTIIHAIHLNAKDINIISKRNTKVIHAPSSDMKLANGVAPIHNMLIKGITIGLGSGSAASNNNMDIFREMNHASLMHKVMRMDTAIMDSMTTFEMATIHGADVLGLGDKVGSIEVGKKGDIVVMDTSGPHVTPMYNPYSHLVYAAKSTDVSTVIIEGKVVMQDRKMRKINESKILKDANSLAEKIRKENKR